MAYTTIPTLTDTALSAANFNAYMRDNQKALKDPPSQNYESNEASNYVSSGTSWQDVDASDFSFSITTTGGAVMIGFIGNIITSVTVGYLDVSVDGTRIVNAAASGLESFSVNLKTVAFLHIIQGLSAGAHTFVLQWVAPSGANTLYAGAGTANYDLHPQFWARELS